MRYLLVISFFVLSANSLLGQKSNKIENDREFRSHLYYSVDSLNLLDQERYSKIKSVKIVFSKKGKIKKYYLLSSEGEIDIKRKNYKLILALLNEKDYSIYIDLLQSNFDWNEKNKYILKMRFILINDRGK